MQQVKTVVWAKSLGKYNWRTNRKMPISTTKHWLKNKKIQVRKINDNDCML
jgi:hypothetical protein